LVKQKGKWNIGCDLFLLKYASRKKKKKSDYSGGDSESSLVLSYSEFNLSLFRPPDRGIKYCHNSHLFVNFLDEIVIYEVNCVSFAQPNIWVLRCCKINKVLGYHYECSRCTDLNLFIKKKKSCFLIEVNQ
jgi:hypothetical protein